jgi:hypothetical protein
MEAPPGARPRRGPAWRRGEGRRPRAALTLSPPTPRPPHLGFCGEPTHHM